MRITNDRDTRSILARSCRTGREKEKEETQTAEGGNNALDEPKWPDVLAFDTESRITVDQSLTFGVWQRCKLVGPEL